MSGHTPGPWKVETVPTSVGVCHRIYPESWGEAPSHGGMCLYADRSPLNPHADGEQEANARYIVRAVNAHDALVGALATTAYELEKVFDALPDPTRREFGPLTAMALGEARRALAAARGEEVETP